VEGDSGVYEFLVDTRNPVSFGDLVELALQAGAELGAVLEVCLPVGARYILYLLDEWLDARRFDFDDKFSWYCS